ncbi:MAG TPA: hypothetical protein VIF64_16680, partial [Pyrinomonadaceae bacterium]
LPYLRINVPCLKYLSASLATRSKHSFTQAVAPLALQRGQATLPYLRINVPGLEYTCTRGR